MSKLNEIKTSLQNGKSLDCLVMERAIIYNKDINKYELRSIDFTGVGCNVSDVITIGGPVISNIRGEIMADTLGELFRDAAGPNMWLDNWVVHDTDSGGCIVSWDRIRLGWMEYNEAQGVA
jgi:hypothetical protein